jgi:hypothetical protein
MGDDLDEQIGLPDDLARQVRPAIGRLPLNAQQPVSVRGVNVPTDTTGSGALPHDTTNTALDRPVAPAVAATAKPPQLPPAKPTIPAGPLQIKTEEDQRTQQQLGKGSGISQIGNPWARGALRGLNVAGEVASAFLPQVNTVLRAIPGTEEHHNQLVARNNAALTADQAAAEKEALTGEAKARTDQAQADAEKDRAQAAAAGEPKPKEEKWTLSPTFTDSDGTPLLTEENSGQFVRATDHKPPTGIKAAKIGGETQEQNKLGFQSVVAKLDAAGLPTGPKTLDKSLDAALKQGKITTQEHAAARSYLAANPTPGTNLEVHIAGAEQAQNAAINKQFEGKEVLAYTPDGKRVLMSYADAKAQNLPPERLVALGPKEAQETRDKAASVQTALKGLDRYRTDFKNAVPQLTAQDRDALRVITSHNDSGHTAGLLSGMFDEIPLAGPMNQYANKLLEGTMTSDQYKQLSPAGKKLASEYFTSVVDNFASMKARLGSVGRNPAMIQAEINTIPLPYLDWESAATQFENKWNVIAGTASSMPEIYQPPSTK